MKWFENVKSTDDVVISSRVRLARNLADYPFPSRLDKETSKKAAFAIKAAFESNYPEKLEFCQINNDIDTKMLVEEHLASPDFCNETQLFRALICDADKNLAVMVNEEDHVRIQAIYEGFNLDKAYRIADEADNALCKGTQVAFDESLGFLTACPTNLGTGMRASVMLHLPALSASGYIKSIVSLMNKIGLCVRGLYGEGSEAQGALYQLSNQITLGISEKDTIEKLKNAVNQIVEKERQLRSNMFRDASPEALDTLWRSYGTLKYAYKLDTAEASRLISNVRLAASCGIIPEAKCINFIKLLIDISPAHVVNKFSDAQNSPAKRDKYRADIIRQALGA